VDLSIEDLMEKMKLLSRETTEEMSPEEIAERFEKVENLTAELESKHGLKSYRVL